MGAMTEDERTQFFKDVDEAARKATWCAVATVDGGVPRVRLVHPTWEGETLWFATARSSPKATQLAANPAVDIQYQVAAPDFVHILVAGIAELLDDQVTREHVWEVMDYDLADFWPDGPGTEDFVAVKISPSRVELSEMFGMSNKRVWRA